MDQKCQIYSIKNYVGKKRQIYNNKIYVRKKTPNLQHQNLHQKNICQIYNINIYMR